MSPYSPWGFLLLRAWGKWMYYGADQGRNFMYMVSEAHSPTNPRKYRSGRMGYSQSEAYSF